MSVNLPYDLCVVGAGSAGYAAATMARSLGRSVVIVESTAPLAGLCILRGCMPSKTLLRSAEVAHLVNEAPALGIIPGRTRIDFAAIMSRKRRIIKHFADYRIEGLEQFPVLRGTVAFAGPNDLTVAGQHVSAAKFLIATGSIINVPDLAGLSETGYVTSDDVLEFDALPHSVVVLGGGPIACELTQYLRRLGVDVTMVQRSATLLSGEDPELGMALQLALEDEGVKVRTGTTLLRAETKAGRKRVHFETSGAQAYVEADEIFVALGRRANVDDLALAAAGVSFNRKGIMVDAYLRTSNPDIFAAGDVINGSTQLVHVAVNEGQTAARNALSNSDLTIDYGLQGARAVFTDPQVAIAGLTERDCRQRAIPYEKAEYPFLDLGKAIAIGQTRGFIKMLAAPDGAVLGVAIVGPEASDLIHEAIALLYFKANVRDVMAMPHLHPTLAEIITYPAEELCERLEHEEHVLVQP